MNRRLQRPIKVVTYLLFFSDVIEKCIIIVIIIVFAIILEQQDQLDLRVDMDQREGLERPDHKAQSELLVRADPVRFPPGSGATFFGMTMPLTHGNHPVQARPTTY